MGPWRASKGIAMGSTTRSAETEQQRARLWLQERLGDGPTATREVARLAKDSGISWRSIERARPGAGVRSFQQNRRWYLALESQTATPQAATKAQTATTPQTAKTQAATPQTATPQTAIPAPEVKTDVGIGILNWLRLAGIDCRLVDGQPVLSFPPDDPDIDRAEVLAECRQYREAIVAELQARKSEEAREDQGGNTILKREDKPVDSRIKYGSTNADYLAPADVISVATAGDLLTPIWQQDFVSWPADRQQQLVALAHGFVRDGFTPVEGALRAYMRISGFCPAPP
jgi:hypothetical protein